MDYLPVLMSKSNEIYPFNLWVNIRARKLYTLYQGTEAVLNTQYCFQIDLCVTILEPQGKRYLMLLFPK
jgi:hypothetical protein